jgi:hypothetical protein
LSVVVEIQDVSGEEIKGGAATARATTLTHRINCFFLSRVSTIILDIASFFVETFSELEENLAGREIACKRAVKTFSIIKQGLIGTYISTFFMVSNSSFSSVLFQFSRFFTQSPLSGVDQTLVIKSRPISVKWGCLT